MRVGRSRPSVSHALSEIAHTLESSEDPGPRITHALGLIEALVPYRRCALLDVSSSSAGTLYAAPEISVDERLPFAAKLRQLLEIILADSAELARTSDPDSHLTLPIIGLDRVIGVLRVEARDEMSYDAEQLRLLSVVSAQLGAYLTSIHLLENQARQIADLSAAHAFQRLFVGIVGHDLRNPLSAILVASSLLRTQKDAAIRADLARRIERNVERATRIVDDLFDLTQIRMLGGMKLARRHLKLRKVLDDVVDDARLTYPRRPIDLVDDAGDLEVEWDPDRIQQLLMNLLSNAVRYGTEGTPIRVSCMRDEDHVLLRVRNQGPPIPSDLLPVIFDPFKRGPDPSSDGPRGLGLGLYIVAAITRSHGGRIEVGSADGETTFTVHLPRAAPTEEEERRPSSITA